MFLWRGRMHAMQQQSERLRPDGKTGTEKEGGNGGSSDLEHPILGCVKICVCMIMRNPGKITFCRKSGVSFLGLKGHETLCLLRFRHVKTPILQKYRVFRVHFPCMGHVRPKLYNHRFTKKTFAGGNEDPPFLPQKTEIFRFHFCPFLGPNTGSMRV